VTLGFVCANAALVTGEGRLSEGSTLKRISASGRKRTFWEIGGSYVHEVLRLRTRGLFVRRIGSLVSVISGAFLLAFPDRCHRFGSEVGSRAFFEVSDVRK